MAKRTFALPCEKEEAGKSPKRAGEQMICKAVQGRMHTSGEHKRHRDRPGPSHEILFNRILLSLNSLSSS